MNCHHSITDIIEYDQCIKSQLSLWRHEPQRVADAPECEPYRICMLESGVEGLGTEGFIYRSNITHLKDLK